MVEKITISKSFQSDLGRLATGFTEIYPDKVFIIDDPWDEPELLQDITAWRDMFYNEKTDKLKYHSDINFTNQPWDKGYSTSYLIHITPNNLRTSIIDKNFGITGINSGRGTINIKHLLLTYRSNDIDMLPMAFVTLEKPYVMNIGDSKVESQAQGITLHVNINSSLSGHKVEVKGSVADVCNVMRRMGSVIESFERSVSNQHQNTSISKADLQKILSNQQANVPYYKDGRWYINGRFVAEAKGGGEVEKQDNTILTEVLRETSDVRKLITTLQDTISKQESIIKYLMSMVYEPRRESGTGLIKSEKPSLPDHINKIVEGWEGFSFNTTRSFSVLDDITTINIKYDSNKGSIDIK